MKLLALGLAQVRPQSSGNMQNGRPARCVETEVGLLVAPGRIRTVHGADTDSSMKSIQRLSANLSYADIDRDQRIHLASGAALRSFVIVHENRTFPIKEPRRPSELQFVANKRLRARSRQMAEAAA